jgi:hypothetical protein
LIALLLDEKGKVKPHPRPLSFQKEKGKGKPHPRPLSLKKGEG